MNKDLKSILNKLEKKGGSDGINITFDEKGIQAVKGKDGYSPIKGQDYFTAREIKEIIAIVKREATPVKGKDYWTNKELAEAIRAVSSSVKVPKDGKDGADGVDGQDGTTPDARAVAIDAVTLLESFDGDSRLSATALRDFEEALDIALKNPDFKIALNTDQIVGIQDLLPQYPPMNAGGSGATFLKSMRDVDLSGLTKNSDGKYELGSGSGTGSGAVTNNYSSILAPQLFNPDSTGVTAETDTFTLSSDKSVAIVTVNGQTIDDSEYSLSGTTLTVTPDNGFTSTSDEVLVFQHTFAVSATGFSTAYTAVSATYTVLATDSIVNCTANTFTVTLPSAATVGSGVQFTIKNSGTGVITVDGDGTETIDGTLTKTLAQYDSITIASDGVNFIII